MAKEQTAVKAEKEVVTLSDGREVAFGVKAKFLKEVIVQDDGTVSVRFDFRNGETRTFVVPPHQMAAAAGHGYSQKLGDWVAGMKNEDGTPASLEDTILEIEGLARRLEERGSWNREAAEGTSRKGGTSVLLAAMLEVTGKSREVIQDFLATKSHAEKLALRKSSRLAGVVQRLEAERASRSGAADNGDELLDALGE